MRDRKIWHNSNIESADGSIEDLTEKFQTFLNQTYRDLFYTAMCFLWLEKQLLFNGHRRVRRFRSGHAFDTLYGLYMSNMVGRDQAMLTRPRWFQVSAGVASELFPDFFKHNPFEEPEYYQWPYKHVGIDHMSFVYQMHNRVEMLEYAEEKKMSFRDFKNWATNYALCYNAEQEEDIYYISLNKDLSFQVSNRKWKPGQMADSLALLLGHNIHESEKTETDSDEHKKRK